ncbi:MAG: cytochrome-c peroxidase [Planctomycetia bacterium]
MTLSLAVWIGLCATVGSAAEAVAERRKPPRPERSDVERAAAARRLRELYRGDPAAWPVPTVDPGVAWREIGLLPEVVHPEANPPSAAKASLGRALFFDTRLSAGGQMACVSCHEPSLGWADGRPLSRPHATAPARNTPTIRNAAFQPALFWDGRAATLEEQVEEALTNPVEMAADRGQVVRMLQRSPGYRKLFDAAFPGRTISFTEVVEAVACFERKVVGGRSRFDGFLRGTGELTDGEVLGLDLFRREARCMNCHHGPVFSDGRFHDLGLSFYGRSNEDLGRYAVTAAAEDAGRFRTPTLRDVTRSSPLMHTGMFELAGVLNMYNAGMVTLKRQPFQRDDPLFPVKSPHLKPLGLNRQDLADLAAFLGTLEEPRHRERPPSLPELDDAEIMVSR